jgi:AcrR family transcriptional regulator
VSPPTFFNYYPTKESVILLPAGFLAGLVEASLRSRPAGEDRVASLAAAALATVQVVESWAESNRELVLSALALMINERDLRRIMLDRRAALELLDERRFSSGVMYLATEPRSDQPRPLGEDARANTSSVGGQSGNDRLVCWGTRTLRRHRPHDGSGTSRPRPVADPN